MNVVRPYNERTTRCEVARPVELNSEVRKAVERLARSRSLPARVVERARIVLRAADGLQDKKIAQELGVTPEKVARWRNRLLDGGIAALQKDASRPGRTRTITDDQVKRVVDMTIGHKPANATHWSTRTMAAAAGISEASVRRIWHAHGLKPHLVRTFKLSRDIRFAEKLETIVRHRLLPERAIVLCADEKESDSGPRPDTAGSASEERPLRNNDSRLQTQRDGYAVRRAGRSRRSGDLHVRRPAPVIRNG